MRRLIASGTVLALSALFIATPAVAAPHKAHAAHHHSKAKPAHHHKHGAKASHKGGKSTRHLHALSAPVVFGAVDGQVIVPEAGVNCVRFVQMNSDFGLTGKGSAWWQEAAGRYERSHEPAPGAVMVFKSSRKISSGHVALVREVVDSRHILIDHSNWSAGRTGRVDLGVEVVDASPANDWSQVQVWYGPIHDIGRGVYPVYGFILPKGPFADQLAQAPGSGHQTD